RHIEEVLVLEEVFEVLQPDVVREAEEKVALVERQPDGVVRRVDHEQPEDDQRGQREQNPLQPLLERPLAWPAEPALRLRDLEWRGLSAQGGNDSARRRAGAV